MVEIINNFTANELSYFDTLSVVILMPIGERPEAKTTKSLVDMISYSWAHGLRVHEMGITERVVVDWARNQLARDAVRRRSPINDKIYTHFLWIDSDIVFNPDLLCQLARHRKDLVSAVYFARAGMPLPLIYTKKDDDPDGLKHYNLLDIPKTLVKVDAFGFGACLLSRRVFEEVPEPWFTIDYRAGEDIAFCKRARDFGFDLYCDGTYSVGHMGLPAVVSGNDWQRWKDENHETYMKDRIQVNLGG